MTSNSSQEPEQAIMSVNAFVTDGQDGNPFIRALAVRTMCRIRRQSVADKVPYVRQTAAFGVPKLFDMIPETAETSGLLDDLLRLLKDDNPMGVANTTAPTLEINDRPSAPLFGTTAQTVTPILSAIVSCSDWCQMILYDGLAKCHPTNPEDGNFLIDRCISYLRHNNPAVVIGSFRCSGRPKARGSTFRSSSRRL
jgi:vesicle coat complex subunit